MYEDAKIIEIDNILYVSSIDVAEHFGKKHSHILRDIRSKLTNPNLGSLNYFIETKYEDKKGELRPGYLMTRDGFCFLVMGFNGKKAEDWKIKYIKAFNKLEKEIKNRSSILKVPQNPIEALELYFEVAKQHDTQIKKIESKVNDLADDAFLTPSEYKFISKLIYDRIREIKIKLSIEDSNKNQNKELYRAINRDVNTVAGVGTRTQIRRKVYNDVVKLISIWEPSAALRMTLEKLGG